MKYIRKGVLSTIFMIMVMIIAGLPVNAETEWSKECEVIHIWTQGGGNPECLYDGAAYDFEPMIPFWTGDDIGVNLTLEWGNDHQQIGELKFEYTIDVWAANFGGPFYTWYIYIDEHLERTAQPYSDSCILDFEEYLTINATIMVDGQSPTCLIIYVYYEIFQWLNDEWQLCPGFPLFGLPYEYKWIDPLD